MRGYVVSSLFDRDLAQGVRAGPERVIWAAESHQLLSDDEMVESAWDLGSG